MNVKDANHSCLPYFGETRKKDLRLIGQRTASSHCCCHCFRCNRTAAHHRRDVRALEVEDFRSQSISSYRCLRFDPISIDYRNRLPWKWLHPSRIISNHPLDVDCNLHTDPRDFHRSSSLGPTERWWHVDTDLLSIEVHWWSTDRAHFRLDVEWSNSMDSWSSCAAVFRWFLMFYQLWRRSISRMDWEANSDAARMNGVPFDKSVSKWCNWEIQCWFAMWLIRLTCRYNYTQHSWISSFRIGTDATYLPGNR